MIEQMNLNRIIIWGGKNEDKSRSPVKWDHDFIIFASYDDKLSVLEDPAVIIPFIFDSNLEEIASNELYEGVVEYKTKEITVELIEGFEYSEYKIYGKSIDFEAITQRLIAGGAKMRKPKIVIDIPGRPPIVDQEKLNNQRYEYPDEKLERDQKLSTWMTIAGIGKVILGIVIFVLMGIYLWQELFIPKIKDVTPLSEDTFLLAKENYIFYSVDKKLTVFKFADFIEDIGYDSTYTIWVPEKADVRDKIVVEQMKNADGEVVYDRGNRIVEFEADPTRDYEYFNANLFEFDTYQKAGDADWARLGELSKGNPQKIVIQGRVFEQEGKYIAHLGHTYAILGDVSDTEPPFYELLEDYMSHAAILFSIKEKRLVNLFGQIERTLTPDEGRNSVDRLIFTFKVDYARKQ